jgi:hypothetical protein
MRKLRIMLPFAALAAALAVTAALALPALAATPQAMTTHRAVARPAAAAASKNIKDGGGECIAHETVSVLPTRYPKGSAVGTAYVSNCVGEVSCHQVATLQIKSIKDPTGWSNVDSGVTTSGCTVAHRSVASALCHSTPEPFDYRTRGIFTIFWESGRRSGPVDLYSPVEGSNLLC